MRSGALGLVVGREVRESLRRKAIWISCSIAMIATAALVIVPGLVGSDETRTVAVVGQPDAVLRRALRTGGAEAGLDVRVRAVSRASVAREAVRSESVDAAVLTGRPATVVVRHRDDAVTDVVRQALVAETAATRLRNEGLARSRVAAALASPPVRLAVVAADRDARLAVATVASLGVYLLLFMITASVANAVAIEKANHVSEVLLATVKPAPLLYGKVIGVGLVGLLPFVAGAIPVLIRAAFGASLPPDTLTVLVSSGAWFVLGAVMYLLAAAALGALVDRPEEVGAALGGLGAVLVGSYLIGQSAADSTLGHVLALFPMSAPMVEPARLALGVSSPAEVASSLALGAVGVLVMVRLAVAVYRRGIVHTGGRMRIREVLRPGVS